MWIKFQNIPLQKYKKAQKIYLRYLSVEGGSHNESMRIINVSPRGYSQFFLQRRLEPSIYCLPPKISGISGIPKKIFEILQPQRNIPILYLDLKQKQ